MSMGKARGPERKTVVSSDEEDNDSVGNGAETSKQASTSPQKPTGRLKSTKSTKHKASQTKSLKKSNGDTSEKAIPKQPVKTIYSFFNAATHRQQSSQTQSRLEQTLAQAPDVEVIQDSSDEDDGSNPGNVPRLSEGSSTALAVRKRKSQLTGSLGDASSATAPVVQKFRKLGTGDRTPSVPTLNTDTRPWTDRFAPVDVSELAVHKRKVSDVRQWIEAALRGRQQKVLVLKGPAGAGKTTTVKMLAVELKLVVVEWREAMTSDPSFGDSKSSPDRFEEFLRRAGQLTGLTLSTDASSQPGGSAQCAAQALGVKSDSKSKLVLVEEFPNTFSRTSSFLHSFRSAIAQYVASPVRGHSIPTPIVLIITETLLSTNTAAADSFTAHRLLGPELATNPFVDTIEFNPVAPTILIKALETVAVKEARRSGRRKTPGAQVLKHLAESGDIRSAISSLEFLCLRGDEGGIWSSRIAFTKPKHSKSQALLTKSEEDALKLISNRESSLGIFHSVGKVLYNKRSKPYEGNAHNLETLPEWISQHQRKLKPETDVDGLLNDLGTDISTFVAALHENYALSCVSSSNEVSLDCLNGCLKDLSDADLLSLDRLPFTTRASSNSTMDGLRQDDLSFQVAVRGCLFNLPSPVSRATPPGGKSGDAHRMFYPASLRLWKMREEIEDALSLIMSRIALNGTTPTNYRRSGEGSRTDGVESWKRNTFNGLDEGPAKQHHVPTRQAAGELKTEVLMDRLPYVAQILSSMDAKAQPSSLLDSISTVIRIARLPFVVDTDDVENEDEYSQGADATLEQWSTDASRREGKGATRQPASTKGSSHQPPISKSDEVSLTVEARADQLVLEDDDIVDD